MVGIQSTMTSKTEAILT